MPSAGVRPARLGDAEQIAEVHVEAWRAAYPGLLPERLLAELSVPERADRWRQILAEPHRTLVGTVGGAVRGFCSTFAPSRDQDAGPATAEIGAVYVRSDNWRCGLGRLLLQEALDQLAAEAYDQVTLWVLAGNERARAFYSAFGFEPDGATQLHPPSGALEVRLLRPLQLG